MKACPGSDQTAGNTIAITAQVLHNLRKAVESNTSANEMASLGLQGSANTDEMRALVDLLANYLKAETAQLAKALASLVSCLSRLLSLSGSETTVSTLTTLQSLAITPNPSNTALDQQRSSFEHSQNMFMTLQKQALSLQTSQRYRSGLPKAGILEVQKAEVDLLWSRIDELLARIHDLSVVSEQSTSQATYEYRYTKSRDYEPSISEYSLSDLPIYDDQPGTALLPPSYLSDGKNTTAQTSSAGQRSEKMQYEYDDLSNAIERLHAISPQLANQRATASPVVDRTKIREGQLAKLSTAIERLSKGRLEDQRAVLTPSSTPPLSDRAKEKMKMQELDGLLDSIGKAAGRSLTDQRVEIAKKRIDVTSSETLSSVCWPRDACPTQAESAHRLLPWILKNLQGGTIYCLLLEPVE